MSDVIRTIFLDEAGLSDKKQEALKVIHYYLDHPEISTVIVSNEMLDAAKTNRCLQGNLFFKNYILFLILIF
jgi:E3 ubiquitin-protein ligase RNF213